MSFEKFVSRSLTDDRFNGYLDIELASRSATDLVEYDTNINDAVCEAFKGRIEAEHLKHIESEIERLRARVQEFGLDIQIDCTRPNGTRAAVALVEPSDAEPYYAIVAECEDYDELDRLFDTARQHTSQERLLRQLTAQATKLGLRLCTRPSMAKEPLYTLLKPVPYVDPAESGGLVAMSYDLKAIDAALYEIENAEADRMQDAMMAEIAERFRVLGFELRRDYADKDRSWPYAVGVQVGPFFAPYLVLDSLVRLETELGILERRARHQVENAHRKD